MNCVLQKRMWLAGASLLAIVLGSGDASAVVFGVPESVQYVVPSTGYYDFRVAGADGGGSVRGGIGAIVGGELFFAAGDKLDIVVGGVGGDNGPEGSGGSGGGGSFVNPGSLLFAAGGGGGADFTANYGAPGIGSGGHPAGLASYGGAPGSGIPMFFPESYGVPGLPAQGGDFPNGGQGAQACFPGGFCIPAAPNGGYGGGGGGGYETGGGGGGAPGGGYGNTYSNAGGYSYVTKTARNAFGVTGGNMNGYMGNGYVSINFVAAPEPSTWAMTLTGFAGRGWLARLRRRKTSPA
jgi:hypothetical protein